MKSNLAAGFVGFLFALGLGLSGMTQPQKVIGFLDVFGKWNPALMFVMVGAIGVHVIAFRLITKRKRPLFSAKWEIPEAQGISKSLVIGSIIFGVGWGIGGYCPGPGIVAVSSLQFRPLIFFVAMILGMHLFKVMDRKWKIKN